MEWRKPTPTKQKQDIEKKKSEGERRTNTRDCELLQRGVSMFQMPSSRLVNSTPCSVHSWHECQMHSLWLRAKTEWTPCKTDISWGNWNDSLTAVIQEENRFNHITKPGKTNTIWTKKFANPRGCTHGKVLKLVRYCAEQSETWDPNIKTFHISKKNYWK